MKHLTIVTLTIMVILHGTIAHSSHYEIIFKEGAYNYDTSKPETDTANKYLAQVTIKKDGQVLNNDEEIIKGSTLPDSWFFYEVWHGEGNIRPPTDADVERIFSEWENISEVPNNYQLIDNALFDFITNINEVFRYATYIPVIYSGTYSFKIGLHKNGQSIAGLGLPDVPRLIGSSDYNKPYDGSNQDQTLLHYDGGYIRTINKNKDKNYANVANGINIHDGRHDSAYTTPSASKFSLGCITINPKDWNLFNSKLPNIEDWKNNKHTGTVTIIREEPDTTGTPTDIPRIQSVQTF